MGLLPEAVMPAKVTIIIISSEAAALSSKFIVNKLTDSSTTSGVCVMFTTPTISNQIVKIWKYICM